ncbi:MAG: CBS domain-containing protein [Nitrosopumilaceae archaeon]
MIAKNIIKKPIGILKKSTISEVIKKLLENNVSRLVVLESGTPVGIITEKDVGFFLFAETTKQGLDRIPLEKIMNNLEYTYEENSLEKCAQIMIEKKMSSLVVGNKHNLEGIFTKTDLVKYYAENYVGKNKVVDYMTSDYVSTHSAAPLFKVVRKLLENKISRLIVKNQSEEPAGIVSFRDLFRISLELGAEEDDTGFTLSDQIRKGFLSEEGFGGISLARDVMSSGIITVKFNEDLTDACNLMLENNVSGLAVLDGNGGLAGIISKTDVTRALAANA